MTKSEALMLMESSLGYSKDDCYNILEVMENCVGMLPPFVDKSVVDVDKDYFDMHVEQAVYSGVFEWEEEDGN